MLNYCRALFPRQHGGRGGTWTRKWMCRRSVAVAGSTGGGAKPWLALARDRDSLHPHPCHPTVIGGVHVSSVLYSCSDNVQPATWWSRSITPPGPKIRKRLIDLFTDPREPTPQHSATPDHRHHHPFLEPPLFRPRARASHLSHFARLRRLSSVRITHHASRERERENPPPDTLPKWPTGAMSTGFICIKG
jgi:hypothetical protein